MSTPDDAVARLVASQREYTGKTLEAWVASVAVSEPQLRREEETRIPWY